MTYIPMHNRFAEGFIEPEASGEAIDPLSSRILPARLPSPDPGALARLTRMVHTASVAAGTLVRAGRILVAIVSEPSRSLIDRFMAWRPARVRRRRALYRRRPNAG